MAGATPTPVWIPSANGPLSGWWHTPPDRRASGSVLLCPPLGREHISSYRTMRTLAEGLAASGLAALRFDYAGTGDSADRSRPGDSGDEGTVAAWQDGITAASAWLAARGAPRLALLGMRMGAVLAGLAATSRTDVDALVLWDPCLSGRHFLREQRALRLVTLPGYAPHEAGVEAPGFVYGPHTVEDMGRLDLRKVMISVPPCTLLLTRDESGRDGFAGATATPPEWVAVPEQSRLLDTSSVLAVEPASAIATITAWLASTLGGTPAPLTPAPPPAPANVSPLVVEEVRFLGPHGVFAVHTASPERVAPHLPTVVFLNVAEEPHIGPGRLWVHLARSLAANGFEVVRTDFNGVGDSPARPDRLRFPTNGVDVVTDKALLPDDEIEAERLFPNPSYDQGNLADVADVVAALDRPVVLVGLCSGAYHAIEAGVALGVAGVCALNPILDFTPPEVRAGLPIDPRRRAVSPRREWANSVKDRRLASVARALMPDVGWRLIDRLGLQPSPAQGLQLLVDAGMRSLVVCSSHDAEPFLERGASTLRRMAASERFTFTVIPELDHALLVWTQRERVSRLLEEHLIATFDQARVGEPA